MSIGEFEASLPYRISGRAAQLFFLIKGEEVQPKLIDDLYLVGAPAFSHLFNLTFSYSHFNTAPWMLSHPIMRYASIRNRIFYRAPSWQEVITDADATAVREAILKWSRRWNLNAGWCFDYALVLLWIRCSRGRIGFVNVQGYNAFLRVDWHLSNFSAGEVMSERLLQLGHLPNNPKRSGWQMLLSRYDGQAKLLHWLLLPRSHKVYQRSPEGWPEWNSTEETRESYLSRIEKETLETIKTNRFLSVGHFQRRRELVNSILNVANSYCNKVEKAQRLRGLRRVRFSKNIERNLLWSVEFQILGKTYTAIANDYSLQQSQKAGGGSATGINITTVKRAVEKTLKFIGLDKRPDSGPGRKRGTVDTASARITRHLGR